ncbi:hypothetical protein ACWEQV_20960 [Rhodococcus aetherivorans]
MKTVVGAAVFATAIVVSACGGPEATTPTVVTTPAAPSASATSTEVTTTLPSTAVTSSSVPSSTPEVGPVTFECGDLSIYQSGTALYSDGTTGYEASCDTYVPAVTTEPPAKVLRYCDYPGTAVYTDGSYSTTDPACAAMRAENTNPNPGGGYPYDPEEDRNGDGVVNGYERCGVRCGDAPTSGDIQTQHGCEQGYITGAICESYTG